MSRSRIIFIIFLMTAMLIATVLLRTTSSRNFFKFRKAYVKQNRLKQQLWQKQLVMETLTNPGAISEGIGDPDDKQ